MLLHNCIESVFRISDFYHFILILEILRLKHGMFFKADIFTQLTCLFFSKGTQCIFYITLAAAVFILQVTNVIIVIQIKY